MYKLIKRVENTDHSERFAILVDTRCWGITVCYDNDVYRICKYLMIQFLCWRFRWSFYENQ